MAGAFAVWGELSVMAGFGLVGALGVIMVVAPRWVRRLIRRPNDYRSEVTDQFLMPGALASLRIVGGGLIILTLFVLAFGRDPWGS